MSGQDWLEGDELSAALDAWRLAPSDQAQAQLEALKRLLRLRYGPDRCHYPDCVENEDGRCPRWLIGDCEGPGNE